ncbi:MAG TPA: hypothetical protein VGY54_27875 [Polyangiaceae bacterium]|jgi:hypothetical protein|nr:hypothetical protein [Polyangiaceae bacterium]
MSPEEREEACEELLAAVKRFEPQFAWALFQRQSLTGQSEGQLAALLEECEKFIQRVKKYLES